MQGSNDRERRRRQGESGGNVGRNCSANREPSRHVALYGVQYPLPRLHTNGCFAKKPEKKSAGRESNKCMQGNNKNTQGQCIQMTCQQQFISMQTLPCPVCNHTDSPLPPHLSTLQNTHAPSSRPLFGFLSLPYSSLTCRSLSKKHGQFVKSRTKLRP